MRNQDLPLAQELLAHQTFLKRLALDLVGKDADDLLQDVWQRALERPPQHGRELRGWLTRVARNLSANRWRDQARRREREEDMLRQQPTGEDLNARLEMRKELVAALDSLSPVSRETILLRYFEGLPPREIAKQQRAPIATVKTRLQRGLAQLRSELDERYRGDRKAWLPAVAALGTLEDGLRIGPLLIGGIAMGIKTKTSAAILMVAIGAYFLPRTKLTEATPIAGVESPAQGGLGGMAGIRRGMQEVTGSAQRDPIAEDAWKKERRGLARNVLRLLVEGVAQDEAGRATARVVGRAAEGGLDEIQESWPARGARNEYDLDRFFERVAERFTKLRDDRFEVELDHPRYFRKRVQVDLAGGQKRNGQTIYEVRIPLVPPALWPEFSLAVRDANTREHLKDVELRCVTTALMGVGQRPGSEGAYTLLGGGRNSPIPLRGGHEAEDSEQRVAGLAFPQSSKKKAQLFTLEDRSRPKFERGLIVFARAPGYAWGRLVLDVSTGASRELLLTRETTLGLRLANLQPNRYAELGMKGTLIVAQPDEQGEDELVWQQDVNELLETRGLRLEGLLPGEFKVQVELSPGWKRKPTERRSRRRRTRHSGTCRGSCRDR